MEGHIRDEEGYPVAEGDRLLPPPDVCPEVIIEHDRFAMSGSPSLGGQAPIEEEPAGRDNI